MTHVMLNLSTVDAAQESAKGIDYQRDAERTLSKQRYEGLGEMNPEQRLKTSMYPVVRRLLKVQPEYTIAADQIFITLMGDDREPRHHLIDAKCAIRR